MEKINGQLEHIESCATVTDTGDGSLADILVLRDGTILVVTGENIFLFENLQQFKDGDTAEESMDR
jgi:hypothetical protein